MVALTPIFRTVFWADSFADWLVVLLVCQNVPLRSRSNPGQTLRWPAMHQGHCQGGGYKLGAKVMRKGPTDDAPTVKIHDDRQVQPAFLGLDISDIAGPKLIASAGCRQLGKSISCDRFIMGTIGRPRPVTPLLTAAEP